uniref:Putative secreted peptide n=1 Tax=Rhipicephalus pulchellus TaxID=72859 RepID=L7M913_RHIPC
MNTSTITLVLVLVFCALTYSNGVSADYGDQYNLKGGRLTDGGVVETIKDTVQARQMVRMINDPVIVEARDDHRKHKESHPKRPGSRLNPYAPEHLVRKTGGNGGKNLNRPGHKKQQKKKA